MSSPSSCSPLHDAWPSARQIGLPAAVESALWRADQLGRVVGEVLPSGFPALDAQLPGRGWPCQALTEVLLPQFGMLEWRLLAPALRPLAQAGRAIAMVGPRHMPHLPGLRHEGLDERSLIWVRADTVAERLWSTEQLIKSHACSAVLAWLPQVHAADIRRLQVMALGFKGAVFVCRPQQASASSSAAPLRVQVGVGLDWTLSLDIIKRKGPPLTQPLTLPSIPGSLRALITPRLSQPQRLLEREWPDVVVRTAVVARTRHPVPH